LDALFNRPCGIALNEEGVIFVADRNNHRIRVISKDGNVRTVAGCGEKGFADGASVKAMFNHPCGIALDKEGNMFVADEFNHRIRKISQGVVSTIAGCSHFGDEDGEGTMAKFHSPQGVAVDAEGSIYVSDTWNHIIRKVTQKGDVATVVGTGTAGHNDGNASQAMFFHPDGIALDSKGKQLYVADTHNNRIRKIEWIEGTTLLNS